MLKSELLFKVYLIDGDSVVRRTGDRHCLALIYHISFEPQIFPVLLNILSQRSNEDPKADKGGSFANRKQRSPKAPYLTCVTCFLTPDSSPMLSFCIV